MNPDAAGITGLLSAAGLGEHEVHHWFSTPRRELDWLTPRNLLRLRSIDPLVGRTVLELVKADIAALKADQAAHR